MNNHDLDKAIHDKLKELELEPPESEGLWMKLDGEWTKLNTGYSYQLYGDNKNYFPAYNTDEVWALLPDYIEVYEEGKDKWIFYFTADKVKGGTRVTYRNVKMLIDFVHKVPNTALKQLLLWTLENHPEAVRKHLETLKGRE